MNEIIKTLLDVFGHPVEYLKYTGKLSPYIVFNYADDRGVNFADDEPLDIEYDVQVHLFCLKSFNHEVLKNQIREALFSHDFSYPSVQVLSEDDKGSGISDNRLNHIIFECTYTKAREV